MVARVTTRARRTPAPVASPPISRRAYLRSIAAKHPPLLATILEDARFACGQRGERPPSLSRRRLAYEALRLMWSSDAFFAWTLYRCKARMQHFGVPILPRLAHRWAMSLAQICIGDPVVIQPGVYLPHGQVVIDGLVEIDSGTTIRPWVTIGLKEGNFEGPKLGKNVRVGTGAKIFGPLQIGAGSLIGANAVVVRDVPPHSRAVGVPARVEAL